MEKLMWRFLILLLLLFVSACDQSDAEKARKAEEERKKRFEKKRAEIPDDLKGKIKKNLKKLKGRSSDIKVLKSLYKDARKSVIEEDVKTMCASAYLLLGERDLYESMLKKIDEEDFEENFTETCESCDGSGEKFTKCIFCKGSKNCIAVASKTESSSSIPAPVCAETSTIVPSHSKSLP